MRPVKRAEAPAPTTRSCWRVAHNEFREHGHREASASSRKKTHVLYDIKYVFRADEVDGRL